MEFRSVTTKGLNSDCSHSYDLNIYSLSYFKSRLEKCTKVHLSAHLLLGIDSDIIFITYRQKQTMVIHQCSSLVFGQWWNLCSVTLYSGALNLKSNNEDVKRQTVTSNLRAFTADQFSNCIPFSIVPSFYGTKIIGQLASQLFLISLVNWITSIVQA